MYVGTAVDKGTFDEKELSQREPGERSDEDPVEPHDELDRKFMRMAREESKESPDEKVKVLKSKALSISLKYSYVDFYRK